MAQRTPRDKGRYFTFLLYPDSAPDDWQLKLQTLDLPIAVSPLHDKDVKEQSDDNDSFEEAIARANGKKVYKKAHRHVIIVAKGPLTADAMRKKLQRTLGQQAVAIVKIVDNIKNMYDYLTHDSIDAVAKKKHRYDKKDLIHLNNFDIDRYIVLDEAEKKELLIKILDVIRNNCLENIFELMDYLDEYHKDMDIANMDMVHDVLKGNTGYIRLYFDGAYQTRLKNQ